MGYNLSLLNENILTDSGEFINGVRRAYSEYVGFFKHYKGSSGNYWRIKITFSNQYSDSDLDIYLLSEEKGWVRIADFNDINGLKKISEDVRGDKFANAVRENIELIEDWLNFLH